jgi:hypothetical protein
MDEYGFAVMTGETMTSRAFIVPLLFAQSQSRSGSIEPQLGALIFYKLAGKPAS